MVHTKEPPTQFVPSFAVDGPALTEAVTAIIEGSSLKNIVEGETRTAIGMPSRVVSEFRLTESRTSLTTESAVLWHFVSSLAGATPVHLSHLVRFRGSPVAMLLMDAMAVVLGGPRREL